jgi:hypothetical protein
MHEHVGKFMKLFNFWENLSSEPRVHIDIDAEGFDLADSVEGGIVHEVLSDFMKPVTGPSVFLVRHTSNANEWILTTVDSKTLIMRGVVFFEDSCGFTRDFDSKTVFQSEVEGRVRIAVYLDEPSGRNEKMNNPVVAMISDKERREWVAYEVNCDACRYKRRRSSFTEAAPKVASSTDLTECSSPCSYTRKDLNQARLDYEDICTLIPSAHQILRITHQSMRIKTGTYTQIIATIPQEGVKWCPLIMRPLSDSNSSEPTICDSPQGGLKLKTKVPLWSEKFQALALEFKNRTVIPSRRNYHLGDGCLFYRTAKTEYKLEFNPESRSLSLIQAFCIALSTSLWS